MVQRVDRPRVPSRAGALPPLDGLRALAIGLVMVMHTAYVAYLNAHGTERALLARTGWRLVLLTKRARAL